MNLSQIIGGRRLAAGCALTAAIWCGQVQAQVLEQVPSGAVAVVKFNDLQKTSDKVAKLAKTLGLAELSPEMKDPLGSLLEKAKMTKGINKSGDAAMVIFAPDMNKGAAAAAEQMDEQEPVALVPVSDYQAFVGNFEKADGANAGAGIDAVKDPDGGKTLYIAHRGNYAIMSDKKGHLNDKAGIKLTNLAMKESDSKDMVFILNMPVVRDKAIPAIKDHRKELIDEMDKGLAGEEQFKPFIPVFDAVVNHALDTANDFLNDADAIVFSTNIDDAKISGAALVDFKSDSKLGKLVADMKPGNNAMLAGLPQGKYFVLAGVSFSPAAMATINSEWIDPVIKSLNDTNTDSGKKIANVLDGMKVVMTSTDHTSVGMIAPTKPMGQESLIQQVAVSYGDAKVISGVEKKTLTDIGDLMGLAPQNKGVKTKFVFGDPKTVDGVELQTYATKLEFDKNDPQGMQAEQILAMIYGPNGQSGSFGVANDKTFVMGQGVSDEVLKELIASAKSDKDVLSDTPGIKTVSAMLPPNPSMVYYVSLDNIITTALRYAQGFGLTVKLKLPAELPPIGVSVATDGSSIRMDGVLPVETVQALVAAGLQAYTDIAQGGKGGGL
jgi:hypothetical protein